MPFSSMLHPKGITEIADLHWVAEKIKKVFPLEVSEKVFLFFCDKAFLTLTKTMKKSRAQHDIANRQDLC